MCRAVLSCSPALLLSCLTDDGHLGEDRCWGGQAEAVPVPQRSSLPRIYSLLEVLLPAPLSSSQGGGVAVPGPDHARGEGRRAARRLQSQEGEKVGLVMFLFLLKL